MFLRPKRTRAGLAFLGGLSISLAVLAGAYWFYQQHHQAQEARWMAQAEQAANLAFEQAHPMEPVYVFARDMRAGEVLRDKDLLLREMPVALIPDDTIRNPADAGGLVIRGAVRANTLCVQSLLYEQQEYPDDARLQEFSAIRLPSRLEENQCIDVRVTFPNGLDYVVLAKKSVQSLERLDADTAQRVWLTVNEEEILRVSSAIVDAYLHPGTVLYALTYVAPDIQDAAVCTYPANAYVQDLIMQNPNIVSHAVTELDRANREWFDAIPDPQPNQPLAIVPAPEGTPGDGLGDMSGETSGGAVPLSDDPDVNRANPAQARADQANADPADTARVEGTQAGAANAETAQAGATMPGGAQQGSGATASSNAEQDASATTSSRGTVPNLQEGL
jgi:hypothetical protein